MKKCESCSRKATIGNQCERCNQIDWAFIIGCLIVAGAVFLWNTL